MKRTLVIGDIHGGLRALKQVLQRASITPDDRLIFLGDLVDGWSESAQVVDYVMELAQQQECIFIKGNHDEWCEDWLRTGQADSRWLPHGGMETVQSYEEYDLIRKDKHLAFIASMNYYEIDLENRLFIH
ncbi:MAG TPA: metallophosphoesterase, partial [Chitinophagaceae bacterium]|nr:metallophosphoesterase [Chitinophagaceae bacterium]